MMLGMASCGAYWAVLATSGDLIVARSACFLTIVFSPVSYTHLAFGCVPRFRPSKNAKKEKKRPGKKFEKGVENPFFI